MRRSRSRSRERETREERSRAPDREEQSRRGRDRGEDKERSRRKDSRSRSPPRRHFREDVGTKDRGKTKEKSEKDVKLETGEASKMSKQERRRAETAIKRQKMLEEERKEKDKVKDRLDLIRQIKGDLSGEEDGMGSGSDDDELGTGELTEEQQMMKQMGFTDFDSTKGKGRAENQQGPAKGAISKHKKREYRQYMNRRGGFNRPLSKMP